MSSEEIMGFATQYWIVLVIIGVMLIVVLRWFSWANNKDNKAKFDSKIAEEVKDDCVGAFEREYNKHIAHFKSNVSKIDAKLKTTKTKIVAFAAVVKDKNPHMLLLAVPILWGAFMLVIPQLDYPVVLSLNTSPEMEQTQFEEASLKAMWFTAPAILAIIGAPVVASLVNQHYKNRNEQNKGRGYAFIAVALSIMVSLFMTINAEYGPREIASPVIEKAEREMNSHIVKGEKEMAATNATTIEEQRAKLNGSIIQQRVGIAGASALEIVLSLMLAPALGAYYIFWNRRQLKHYEKIVEKLEISKDLLAQEFEDKMLAFCHRYDIPDNLYYGRREVERSSPYYINTADLEKWDAFPSEGSVDSADSEQVNPR